MSVLICFHNTMFNYFRMKAFCFSVSLSIELSKTETDHCRQLRDNEKTVSDILLTIAS